jgi:hypothetical protein
MYGICCLYCARCKDFDGGILIFRAISMVYNLLGTCTWASKTFHASLAERNLSTKQRLVPVIVRIFCKKKLTALYQEDETDCLHVPPLPKR